MQRAQHLGERFRVGELTITDVSQAEARLEELRITLSNTRIVSPVDGFVGKQGYAVVITPDGSLRSWPAPVRRAS